MTYKYEKTIYAKSGHLHYGQGTPAKPQVDNDKIYFGGRLKKDIDKKLVVGKDKAEKD